MQLSSIILYAAMHTGQPCETVFKETARAASFLSRSKAEREALDDLAEASCQLSNPDIIWQIVSQESNFRFLIARENFPNGSFRVYEGQHAIQFLSSALPNKRNVDIGPMQFNWTWHKQGFARNPLLMLSPAAQVDYFLHSYGDEIYNRCMGRWIGCYHNTGNRVRAERYEASVLKKGRMLRLHALQFLRKQRASSGPERNSSLPVIIRSELDAVLAHSKNVPLPVKRFLHYGSVFPMKRLMGSFEG